MTKQLALLLFGLHLTACAKWQVPQMPLRQLVEEEQPGRIRIYRGDGSRMELTHARIEADSITALSSVRVSPVEFHSEPVKIPLADVRAFEIQRFSVGRTFAFVVGIPAGLMFACAGGIICGGL